MLWLSILIFFVGPLLTPWLRPHGTLMQGLDGFVVVAIAGLALLHLIPESVEAVGWPALLAMALGLVAPLWLHGPLQQCAAQRSTGLLVMATAALGLHAFMDGVALAPSLSQGRALGLAVVLHRLLEGLGVWWLLRHAYGAVLALLVLGLLGYATFLGQWGALWATQHGFVHLVPLLQASVTGSLLHVLLRHGPLSDEAATVATDVVARQPRWQIASGAGGLAAVGVLRLLSHPTPSSAATWHFLACMLPRTAWALGLTLGSVLLTHAMTQLWPSRWRRLIAAILAPQGAPKFVYLARLWQAAQGVVLGVSTDTCSCGLIPLYQHSLAAAATPEADGTRPPAAEPTPLPSTLGFLATAPAMGFAGLYISLGLLGWRLALWRLGTVVLAGASVALLAPRLALKKIATGLPRQSVATAVAAVKQRSDALLWRDAWHFSWVDVLDHLAPWTLFGFAVAANVSDVLQPLWLTGLQQAHVEVFFLALVGAPFYLSTLSATLVGAALLAKGASVGAVLAFFVTGPMLSVSTFVFLRNSYHAALAWRFCLSLFGAAWLLGSIVNRLSPTGLQPLCGAWQSELASWLGVALVLVSLCRQGVRPFLAQIAVPKLFGGHSHHHRHTLRHTLPPGR